MSRELGGFTLPYPDVVEGRLAGDVVEQEQRCKKETDNCKRREGAFT